MHITDLPTVDVPCRDCGTVQTIAIDGRDVDGLLTYRHGRYVLVCADCVKAAQAAFNWG